MSCLIIIYIQVSDISVNKSGVKTKTQKQVETNKYKTNNSGDKTKTQ